MNKFKSKKGITLVALVITIIILLILAGISIATLKGSGLFENARLAEQKSKNAQELEDATLKDYENKIEGYLNGSRNYTAIDYSTTEQDTGLKWIDGKKIYQRVIEINQAMPASGTAMIVECDFIPVDTLINIDCLYETNKENGLGCFAVTSARGEIVYTNANVTGKSQLHINQTQTSGNTAYAKACIMQYTKTTD